MISDGEAEDDRVVTLRDVAFGYDGQPVLSNVSFDVERGECVGVMGANGAGKTSLLKLIAGLREPTDGSVDVVGVVGFAPENPRSGLFAETVADEVAFFPRNRGLDVDRRVEVALDAMAVDHLADRNPYSLSVGEQRRVSIASVLSGAPAVLALDEPTAGIDRREERRLTDRLDGLDATVVFSTHSADFAYAVADRVALLSDGELLEMGNARALLTDGPLLREAGVREPGPVAWARRHGFDEPPADVESAVAMIRGQR